MKQTWWRSKWKRQKPRCVHEMTFICVAVIHIYSEKLSRVKVCARKA
jgi:hypothetical protein